MGPGVSKVKLQATVRQGKLVPEAPSERKAVSELRRWCPESGLHQDADDAMCASDHNAWAHRLRLRRMLVCSVCEQGYFNRAAFDAHECHDAY